MLEQQAFDFDDRNVLAAADDHVLGAPGNAHIAVAVDAREIAGVEPAVGIGVVELRPLQVADEIEQPRT